MGATAAMVATAAMAALAALVATAAVTAMRSGAATGRKTMPAMALRRRPQRQPTNPESHWRRIRKRHLPRPSRRTATRAEKRAFIMRRLWGSVPVGERLRRGPSGRPVPGRGGCDLRQFFPLPPQSMTDDTTRP